MSTEPVNVVNALQMFPALDTATEAALRASIERFGVLMPIVVDQHGRILDGSHRARIADELGVPYEKSMQLVTNEDEAVEIARTLNMDRRHLDREQRQEIVGALRSEGHSLRAIAGALGVDPATVYRDSTVASATVPDRITGLDGKSRPATMPKPGETVTDDFGEERLIADVEQIGSEVVFHDDQGDALIVDKQRFEPNKPDLGDGVSHPARYSFELIPVFADLLDGCKTVLDPFAGTGRIHELQALGFETVGIEIEQEWAALHPDTSLGNALDLPHANETFDAICTSPTYGNRLADHHDAADPESRRSYKHDLGHDLHEDNSGQMHWGDDYRAFHEAAWIEALRVLRPGGTFVLNIKDHIRGGTWQDVTAWHVSTLVRLGLELPFAIRPVAIQTARSGSNSDLRVGAELVIAFRKAA